MKAQRTRWKRQTQQIDASRIVCLDESGSHTTMTRHYGRAPCGERCHDRVPADHWRTTTMLSAIRVDEVIEPASLAFDGPMNAETFLNYVQCYLAPNLWPGDLVVMDNLSSHKTPGVKQAIEAVDAEVWYLPPYSPDLNPIELMWSKVKEYLRAAKARTQSALVRALGEALRTVTEDDLCNWFRHAGYDAHASG